MYWTILRGRHAEGGKVYHAGDTFESDNDLSKLNQPPYSIKFEPAEAPDAADGDDSD